MPMRLLVLALVLSGAAALQAATGESYGMLSYKADPINIFTVYSEKNPAGFPALGTEFSGLMQKVRPAYAAFAEFESKRMTGYIISITGTLAGAGLAAWGLSHDAGGGSVNIALFAGGVATAWAAGFVSSMFIRDSDSAFYRAVHEYNRTAVSAFMLRGGAGVRKDMKF